MSLNHYKTLVEKRKKGEALSTVELQILEQVEIGLAREDFTFFSHLMRPYYKWAWFHKYIMERLQSKVMPKTEYDREHLRLLFRMGDQHGKGLAHGTPVKTINGWKNIENIKCGDMLDSGLGYPTKVTGVFPQGLKECYKITFSDGRWIICDESHLWEIHSAQFKENKVKVVNTNQLLQLHNNPKYCKKLCVPNYIPLDKKETILPIDPYLLGVLIGTTNKFVISLNNEYLNASYKQRLSLIQGVMDTNGNINKHGIIEYVTGNHQLAIEIQKLIRSIGGQCQIKICTPIYKSLKRNVQLTYKLTIKHFNYKLLFSLPQKLDKCKKICQNGNDKLAIWNIEPVGQNYSTCIKVDNKRGLFVTKDYIVTHNTELTARLFISWILGRFPNWQLIYVTYDKDRAKEITPDIINTLINPLYKKIFPEFQLSDEMLDVERKAEKSGQKLTNTLITNANSPKNGKQGRLLLGGLADVLGNSGDLIIADDLFAGYKEAMSPKIRENKWRTFASGLISRQQKHTPIIVSGTWWHREDVIGRIQSQFIDNEENLEAGTAKWELIEFNSQKDERDYPYDPRKYGEYLWAEERLSAYLDQKQMSPMDWQIKHQNIPINDSGVLFQPTSFRIYDTLPTDLDNMKIIISIDSNYKVTNTSDRAGIGVWAVYNMNAYLLEYLNEKYTLPQLLETCVKLTIKYPKYYSILVEVKAQGQPFVDMSPLYGLSRVHSFDPQGKGDKRERANVVLPIFDAGQVHVPSVKLYPSINLFVNQYLNFTGENGRPDDLVDQGVQMFMHYDYLFRGVAARAPIMMPKQSFMQYSNARVNIRPTIGRKRY